MEWSGGMEIIFAKYVVFLSFVSLCKGEHYYRTLLLCTLHHAKLIQKKKKNGR